MKNYIQLIGTNGRCSNLWKQNQEVVRGIQEKGLSISLFFWFATSMNRALQFFLGELTR